MKNKKKGIDIQSCIIIIGIVLFIVAVIFSSIRYNKKEVPNNQTYIAIGKVVYNNNSVATLMLENGMEYNVTDRNDLHTGDICKITFTDEETPDNYKDDIIQEIEKISE